MKRVLLALIILVFAIPAAGQRINPNAFGQELSFGVGAGATFKKNYGSDVSYWLNYSKYYSRHIGARFGVQYMPEYLGVQDFVRFPMAFSLRTGMREANEALAYGAVAAIDLLDLFLWESDNIFVDMMAVFLISLVSRAEFFVGLTPGFISGGDNIHTAWYTGIDGNTYKEYHGIRKAGDFFCSADAGMNFTWRIWRFTINMSPVVHYNFSENFHIYSQNETTVHPQDTPIHWLFSMNFGLGYLF